MLSRLRSAARSCARAQQAWERGVKVLSNELRTGSVIEDKEGRLLEVLKFEHTHGQGRASGFVQLEARCESTPTAPRRTATHPLAPET
jgi:Elongation factor P (EF-P) KOW-like domain